MNKITSRLACAVLMLALILTGCGTAGDGGAQNQTSGGGAGESPAQTAAAGEVKFPLETGTTLTAFVLNAQAVSDLDNNYFTELLEKKTNVHLDFKYNVTGDDGKTKLNLLMAGNDLPDIFIRTGWTKAEALLYGTQGLIIPLNGYLGAAKNWNKFNAEYPTRAADLTMTDGNIYCYGGASGPNHVNYQARMWIYKPWVDKLAGGKLPATTDEFYDFLSGVKTRDPNGNGKADEIPLTGSIAQGQWATDPTTFILNAFLQTNNFLSNTNSSFSGLVVNNGKVEFQFTKDAFRNGLIYLNKLYKEGLLDNQTFTQDGTQLISVGTSQTHVLGAAPGGCQAGFTDISSMGLGKLDPIWSDYAVLPPLKGPDGVQFSYYHLPSFFGNGYVSKNCKTPELAVQLFDYMTEPEMTLSQSYGPQGTAWDFVTEGTAIDGGAATWKEIPATRTDAQGKPDYGLGTKQPAWPSDIQIAALGDFKSHEMVANPDTSLEYILFNAAKTYSQYKPADDTLLPNFALDEEQARQISDYTTSIGKYVNQATVQFITGDLDIGKDWETYTGKLDNMDLAGYLKLEQEAYDRYKQGLSK